MNQSRKLPELRLPQSNLVIIDSRHTLYEYRAPFKNVSGNVDEWLEANTTFNQILPNFFVQLIESNQEYVFLFFHKSQSKNQALLNLFKKFCIKNQIVIPEDKLLCCNKAEVDMVILKEINLFKNRNKTIYSLNGHKRGQSDNNSKFNNLQAQLFLISHNPISMRIASILMTLNNTVQLQMTRLKIYLFSSYFHHANKKQILEEHFYNFNYQQRKCSLTTFQHISVLNQIFDNYDPFREYEQNKITVGYYFYPKKTNELILNGVLRSNEKVQMVPIDFRFYNKCQYGKIQVLFQKIQDLNKKKEIKFSDSEVDTIRKNYNKILEEYKIKNVDPVHSIAIIAERIKFQSLFQKIFTSKDYVDYQNIHGNGIQLMNPVQLSFDNNSEVINGLLNDLAIEYPVIVKSKAAAFTPNCHTMGLALSQQGFTALLSHKGFKGELILQEIIDHESIIYKVYCLGSHVIVQKRKSIPNIKRDNFKTDEDFVVFDSQLNVYQQVTKHMIIIEEKDNLNFDQPHDPALKQLISYLSIKIGQAFEVSLFGYDIIGNFNTLKFYIIDINHFPGYKNVLKNLKNQQVPKIKDLFDQLFLDKVNEI